MYKYLPRLCERG